MPNTSYPSLKQNLEYCEMITEVHEIHGKKKIKKRKPINTVDFRHQNTRLNVTHT